jgi:YgiT-type zinc finger domain-containing protein
MSAPLRLRMSVPEPPVPTSAASHSVRTVIDLDETLPLGTMRRLPPQDVLPMRCLSCQGRVERATAPVQVLREGCNLAWDAVPAWVCTHCKRPYFEPREVELVRRSLHAVRRLPKRT